MFSGSSCIKDLSVSESGGYREEVSEWLLQNTVMEILDELVKLELEFDGISEFAT